MKKRKELAISVKDLHKSFKLPRENHSGIKQKIINTFKRNGEKGYEFQNVLRGLDFEVEKGEFFGIVGRNGSGKSTLLKTLAGIYAPEKGIVQVNGSLVPFIELGVGFNPELTGRENVFLNGALLGFSHDEMDNMYEDIVEFAELEKFMDQKLKNYSSGMQVRLAFSIAIRANGDILLLDEVLAVGDEAFQRKCYEYFAELKRDKKTVILVTHNMSAVEQFCSKAMLIEDGSIKIIGKPHDVSAAYSKSNEPKKQNNNTNTDNSKEEDSEIDIKITNKNNEASDLFTYGDDMYVTLSWSLPNVKNGGVAIFTDKGEYVFGPNTYQDGYSLKGNNLTYKVKLNLAEGAYFLKARLSSEDDSMKIAFTDKGPTFRVTRDYNSERWGGVTKLEHEWS